MRVLIVGAGLGGLCLAHGLRQAGHHVHILERRPSPADQPASYGIHLNADGLRALYACLPAENWQQLVAAAAPARDLIRFYDAQLHVLAVRDRETSADNTDPITRRRGIRRNALLLGLNHRTTDRSDLIQWGQPFTRYEEHLDGTVAVPCTDGSTYTADLLVGADGSNSAVRGQRLPRLARQDLGIVNIAGRVPLTPQVLAQLPAALVDGAINNVVPADPGWMFVSTWNAHPGDDLDRFAVWAWAAARDSYPSHVEARGGAELAAHVADRITHWAPALRFPRPAADRRGRPSSQTAAARSHTHDRPHGLRMTPAASQSGRRFKATLRRGNRSREMIDSRK